MKDKPEIIAYITNNKDRIITGNALCLYITDETERKQTILEIGRALRANIIQLKNGDYMIISDT